MRPGSVSTQPRQMRSSSESPVQKDDRRSSPATSVSDSSFPEARRGQGRALLRSAVEFRRLELDPRAGPRDQCDFLQRDDLDPQASALQVHRDGPSGCADYLSRPCSRRATAVGAFAGVASTLSSRSSLRVILARRLHGMSETRRTCPERSTRASVPETAARIPRACRSRRRGGPRPRAREPMRRARPAGADRRRRGRSTYPHRRCAAPSSRCQCRAGGRGGAASGESRGNEGPPGGESRPDESTRRFPHGRGGRAPGRGRRACVPRPLVARRLAAGSRPGLCLPHRALP